MHKPQLEKYNVLGWLGYLVFGSMVIVGLPRAPEISDRFLFVTAAAFVILVQGGATVYMLFFERELMPKSVADEAKEFFSSKEYQDAQAAQSSQPRKCA